MALTNFEHRFQDLQAQGLKLLSQLSNIALFLRQHPERPQNEKSDTGVQQLDIGIKALSKQIVELPAPELPEITHLYNFLFKKNKSWILVAWEYGLINEVKEKERDMIDKAQRLANEHNCLVRLLCAKGSLEEGKDFEPSEKSRVLGMFSPQQQRINAGLQRKTRTHGKRKSKRKRK